LLGMGDLSGLLERAQEAFTEEDAKDMSERLMSGDFTLEDLYEQMSSVRKMGSFSKIMEMIPGMGQLKLPKEALDVQEQQLEKWRYIIDSMTPYERTNPDVVSVSRIERISKGSGTGYSDVRGLLKQYKQAKKMSKMLKGGSEKKIEKLMKRMGSQMPR
jgi:signal recognition particle subunit SRP54